MTYPYGGSEQPPSEPPQQDPWSQPAPPPPGQPAPDPSWPGQQTPGPPVSANPYPGPPVSANPYPGPPVPGQPLPDGGFGQPGYLPPGQPGYPPPYGAPAPKKRRTALIVSLVLVLTLLLCGGGGTAAFVLLYDTENGEGAAEPVAAVEKFLEAVYHDKDVEKAASLVCSAARDKNAISEKIAEIEEYEEKYDQPRFRWDKPKIDDQNKERTVVSVQLDITTRDEKTTEQKLVFTVVQKTGWWVCEVG